MSGPLLSSRSPRLPLSERVITAARRGRSAGVGSSFISSPVWMVLPFTTRANTPSRGMMQSPVCRRMAQSLWHSLPIWVISSTASPMAKKLGTGRVARSNPSTTRFSPKAP